MLCALQKCWPKLVTHRHLLWEAYEECHVRVARDRLELRVATICLARGYWGPGVSSFRNPGGYPGTNAQRASIPTEMPFLRNAGRHTRTAELGSLNDCAKQQDRFAGQRFRTRRSQRH